MVGVVLSTTWLSPTMIRIVVGGEGLADFAMNDHADAYVKLVFPRPGVEYPRPLDLGAVREQLPAELWPQQRTYTVRRWDRATRVLTIDFVVHGDEGLAGPWARAAKVGDELMLIGPGGGYSPDPSTGWHLFVGDESALPAIAASLERLPESATGQVVVEVDVAAHEQPLAAPAGVQVTWVHREGGPLGVALVRAVSALSIPVDQVRAFVHGEAGVVKELRHLLKVDRGIALSSLSISGYWRVGATDEAWRSAKAAWNRDIEQSEAS